MTLSNVLPLVTRSAPVNLPTSTTRRTLTARTTPSMSSSALFTVCLRLTALQPTRDNGAALSMFWLLAATATTRPLHPRLQRDTLLTPFLLPSMHQYMIVWVSGDSSSPSTSTLTTLLFVLLLVTSKLRGTSLKLRTTATTRLACTPTCTFCLRTVSPRLWSALCTLRLLMQATLTTTDTPPIPTLTRSQTRSL